MALLPKALHLHDMPSGSQKPSSASLKAQLGRAVFFFAFLALLATVVVLYSAYIHRRSVDELTFAFRGARIAYELDDDITQLHRMYSLREREGFAEQEEQFLIARIRNNLEQAEAHIADPVEAEVVANLTKTFNEVASRLSQPGLTPQQHLAIWFQSYESLNRSVSALSALNRALARSVLLRAAWWNRIAAAVSVIIIVSLAAAVVLFARLGKRRILAPLSELATAISASRQEKGERRAPEDGPFELAEIAKAFNELTAALRKQRENQMSFIASVVHDFRNPLAALKTSSAMLLRNKSLPQDPSIRKALEVAERQVDRLSQIADDLLDATRIEAGRLELRLTHCDLRDIACHSTELYRQTSERHSLRFVAPEEPIIVVGDTARLEQVSNNLVSNAIKYSPQGGAVIVTVAVEDGHAVLSVTDEGVGIPKEDFGVLFEPFRRLRATRETIPGVGLGLSVVRRIIDAHGGRIEVDSEVGVGSTFRVVLTLSSPSAPLPFRNNSPGNE